MIYGTALFLYAQPSEHVCRLVWWNVENLFDCEDDSLVRDDEFLPTSAKKWTKNRYYKKLWQIGRVISAMGDTPPAIIGLGEVEGEKPLRDLTQYTLRNLAPYNYICTHGADTRGIQVAMLYDPRQLKVLSYKEVNVSTKEYKTRNYLHATAVLMPQDTIDIYVCHWPSQWGGTRASDHKRLAVARRVVQDVVSVKRVYPQRRILMMGDFNEESDSPALKNVLTSCDLTDCMARPTKTDWGTHYYKGEWSILDHILVSQALLPLVNASGIWKKPYLLEKNNKGCSKPYRTYLGTFYHGGYSDHLPIYIDITK